MKNSDHMHALYMRLRAYRAIVHISTLSRKTFRGALVINGLLVGIYIWTMKQLYAATFASAGTSHIGGLTLAETVWLIMFVQSFERATWPNPISLIDDEIKSGAITYALQRPYSYIVYHLCGFLGRVVVTAMGNLVLGAVFAFLLVGPCIFSVRGLVSGAIAISLGYMLDFFIFFIFGVAGLWVEDVKPFTWLYSKAKLVLGGACMPIAFFPQAAQKVVLLLPFSNLYYTASYCIVHFDPWLFVRCITVQICWVSVLAGCAYALFRKGVRHVTFNGG